MNPNDYVQIKEYAIGGKLVTAFMRVPYDHIAISKSDEFFKKLIKTKMVNQIVDKLLEDGLVEITQQEDYANQEIILRAHAYIAPNDQVKILRTLA